MKIYSIIKDPHFLLHSPHMSNDSFGIDLLT